MHQMEYVCYRLLKIFIHLKDNQGTLCGRLRFGIGNPGIASCDGELGADGVPFPGSGSTLDCSGVELSQPKVWLWAVFLMHQMEYVCYRLLRICILLKHFGISFGVKLHSGIHNPQGYCGIGATWTT
ncbi:hypothetical protein Tsp_14987 [Trichinella spiralis]|uniref:hypothetical protein n=1 Tax=Trichinella spiralis TaxID=6334 RepID=UPI0001EFDCE9|nr:hypothetical protein Tsp_14987 [Trichinella spiralis]